MNLEAKVVTSINFSSMRYCYIKSYSSTSQNTLKMSLKSNKGSRTSGKGVDKARPWPDLPQQLVSLIGKQSTLMQSITSFGGITKSWMATSRNCNGTSKSQWPQLSQKGEEQHKKKPEVFNIVFHEDEYRSSYRRKYPFRCECDWEYLVGCSHGVLVAKGVKSQKYLVANSHGVMVAKALNEPRYFLWAPELRLYPITLPSWDTKVPFMFVTLSFDITYRRDYVVMVLTGITSPALVFFRASSRGKESEGKWVRQENTMVDPYGSNQCTMQFSNAIGFEGKFYALTLQGALVVIEDLNDSQLTITALSKHRAVPSIPCKHFRECLVESRGEILLVFLISRKTYNVVDHVEVFRLHAPKLSWVKMDSLGDDRTLFFAGANCCMSVNASKVGCRKNCVYFSHLSKEGWWVYDMKTNCVLPPGLSNAYLAWDDAHPTEGYCMLR